MLPLENSGLSMDASVRIALIDRDVPSYFRGIEHLLRYCARPPFALERLSVSEHLLRYCARPPFALEQLSVLGEDSRITRVRYVLPRHKAANWGCPGRSGRIGRPTDLRQASAERGGS